MQAKKGCLCEFEVVHKATPKNSVSPKELFVDCPPGKIVIGGGVRIVGALKNVALSASGPDGPPDAPNQWFASAIEVGPGSGDDWALRVDLFCAKLVP